MAAAPDALPARPAPPAPPAGRALGARVVRGIGFTVALCIAIAVLLAVMDGNFPVKLVYSLAIGLCCWAVTDGIRLLVAALRPGTAIGWAGMLPLAAVAVLVGPLAGLGIGDVLTGRRAASLLSLDHKGTQITLVLSVLGTVLAVLVLTTLERLSAARARAEAAQRQAAETHLRLLQSQLEPHMLFNTLANLRVLIGLDPPRAQAMLDRLIAFLRATLDASRRDTHPLADEFARVADYLGLMAVRMGPRLATALDLPPALAGRPVPPLLLQPLVENAIKHGLEPQVAGGRIEVRAEQVGPILRLQVRDTGAGLGATPRDGARFGLQQVRERLHSLYGDRATLRLVPGDGPDGGTLAQIDLPLIT